MGDFGVFLIFQSFISVASSCDYSLRPFHVGFRKAANQVISPDGLGEKKNGAGGDFISHLLEYNVQGQQNGKI